MTGRWTYRCHACGAVLASWAEAERHADATGHARIDVELPR